MAIGRKAFRQQLKTLKRQLKDIDFSESTNAAIQKKMVERMALNNPEIYSDFYKSFEKMDIDEMSRSILKGRLEEDPILSRFGDLDLDTLGATVEEKLKNQKMQYSGINSLSMEDNMNMIYESFDLFERKSIAESSAKVGEDLKKKATVAEPEMLKETRDIIDLNEKYSESVSSQNKARKAEKASILKPLAENRNHYNSSLNDMYELKDMKKQLSKNSDLKNDSEFMAKYVTLSDKVNDSKIAEESLIKKERLKAKEEYNLQVGVGKVDNSPEQAKKIADAKSKLDSISTDEFNEDPLKWFEKKQKVANSKYKEAVSSEKLKDRTLKEKLRAEKAEFKVEDAKLKQAEKEAIGGVGSAVPKGKLAKAMDVGTHIFAAVGAINTYNESRDEGKGVITSAVKAAGSAAFDELLGGWIMPYQLAKATPKMIFNGVETIAKSQRSLNSQSRRIPFANASFNDNQQAFTMRQAGMELARNSQYNLQQSMLGNEAQYLK